MNLPTILVLAALAAWLVFALVRLRRGGGRCGGCTGDCAHCAARCAGRDAPDHGPRP